ncbi:MAG: hypothetical protein U0441_00880 [Polyangiaceae bacterium]
MKPESGPVGDDAKAQEDSEDAPQLFGAVRAQRAAPLSLWAKIMRAQKLTRLAFVAVFLVLIPLYYQFRGDGKLELVAEGRPIELFVDGAKIEPAAVFGDHRTYLVKPGKHAVQVRDGETGTVTAEHAIDLASSSTHLVIPTAKSRCYAHVNLTKRLEQYANGTGKWPPEIARRLGPAPFELPQWTYLSADTLPRQVGAMSMVFWLLPIDCAAPDPSDEEILRRAKGHIP